MHSIGRIGRIDANGGDLDIDGNPLISAVVNVYNVEPDIHKS